MSGSGSKTTGFTLVELLVVIAIIAVVAGMLFPVLSRTRESARRATCQSNLRHLGTAFKLYAQDYDERLPLGILAVPNPAWPPTWDMQIQPYLKSAQVIMCPSDTFSDRVDVPGVGKQMFRSYSLTDNVAGRSLAQVPAPASTVLLLETGSVSQKPGDIWGWGFYATVVKLGKKSLTPEYPVRWELPEFRHNEMGNYLFLDTHVKAHKGPNPRFAGYKRDGEGIALCGNKDLLPQ